MDALTDSNGLYEIAAPAGQTTLLIENRYRNGVYDRFALLQDSVVMGDVRVDYQFSRWHVKGQVLGKDGGPMRAGTVMYFIQSHTLKYDVVGSPVVPVREGAFEIDICPLGEYVFWPNPYAGWLMTSIPIHGDTTITIDMRKLAEEKGSSK